MKRNELESPALDSESVVALASAVAPAELSTTERASMRERILGRIKAAPPSGTITLRAREGNWVAIAQGVTRKMLRQDQVSGRMSYLIRMEPGTTVPNHGHAQVEECLVLEGDVLVGEQQMGAGDWHIALPGSIHHDFRTRSGCLLFIQSELRA